MVYLIVLNKAVISDRTVGISACKLNLLVLDETFLMNTLLTLNIGAPNS